jgi:hypothetical protein
VAHAGIRTDARLEQDEASGAGAAGAGGGVEGDQLAMTQSKAQGWRKRWYVLGSIATGVALLLLAHGPSMNRVDFDWSKLQISQARTEKPENEGRISILTERRLGPLTITSLRWESVSNRVAIARSLP